MNNLDKSYCSLLEDILNNGVRKQTRNGETLAVFGRQTRHKMSEGFPLLTTKKMYWKGIVTELLWFLKGDTNIKYLVDNDVHIWDGDAYKRYERAWNWDLDDPLPKDKFIERIKTDKQFAKTWGELGPVYGKQWRSWTSNEIERKKGFIEIDQIQNLINELKTNPDSRRLMVSAWNVGELDQMTLPPCHYGFQVYTRELSFEERYNLYKLKKGINSNKTWEEDGGNSLGKINGLNIFDDIKIPTRAISLMWNQRSVDTFLGLPFNIASYGLLLEIIAKEVNMVPGELIGNLGDTHLYLNHIEQAKEQISREPFKPPTLKMNPIFLANLEHKSFDEAINGQVNFELENYQSHPTIKAPLSN